MAKRIALIAHDNMKPSMVEWCKENREILSHHFLCGTGTTAARISEAANLPVKAYLSGPLGGDQQIGARVAGGEIDIIIFFSDPLTAMPHDPAPQNRSGLRYPNSQQQVNRRLYFKIVGLICKF